MLDKLKKMKPKKMYEKEAETDLDELLGGSKPRDIEDDMSEEEDLLAPSSEMDDGEELLEEGKEPGVDLLALDDDSLVQELELRGYTVKAPKKKSAKEDLLT